MTQARLQPIDPRSPETVVLEAILAALAGIRCDLQRLADQMQNGIEPRRVVFRPIDGGGDK